MGERYLGGIAADAHAQGRDGWRREQGGGLSGVFGTSSLVVAAGGGAGIAGPGLPAGNGTTLAQSDGGSVSVPALCGRGAW